MATVKIRYRRVDQNQWLQSKCVTEGLTLIQNNMTPKPALIETTFLEVSDFKLLTKIKAKTLGDRVASGRHRFQFNH